MDAPIRLAPHQRRVVDHMLALATAAPPPARHGLLVAHKPGSGKTISALHAALALMQAGRISAVFVVAPNNVQAYWEREAARVLGAQVAASRAAVLTHHSGFSFLERDVADAVMGEALLVVDEAHNLRTQIELARCPETGAQTDTVGKGKLAARFVRACQRARLVMLLTGTPVVNDTTEMVNMLAALHRGTAPVELAGAVGRALRAGGGGDGRRAASASVLDSAFGARLAAGAFSVHMPPAVEDMPTVREEVVRLVMDPAFYRYYVDVESRNRRLLLSASSSAAFFTNVRQAINAAAQEGDALAAAADGPKLRWVEQRLDGWLARGPLAIYSNWAAYGVGMLTDLLIARGVQGFEVITGDMSAARRGAIVQRYNAGSVPVLLFTAAGSEGMDLKGTRTVVLMEPHWHEARMEQVAARAARRGSHSTLPPAERTVDVYRLLLVKPDVVPADVADITRKPSVDVFLHDLAQQKKEWIERVMLPWMTDNSIEAMSAAGVITISDSDTDADDSGSDLAGAAEPQPRVVPPVGDSAEARQAVANADALEHMPLAARRRQLQLQPTQHTVQLGLVGVIRKPRRPSAAARHRWQKVFGRKRV